MLLSTLTKKEKIPQTRKPDFVLCYHLSIRPTHTLLAQYASNIPSCDEAFTRSFKPWGLPIENVAKFNCYAKHFHSCCFATRKFSATLAVTNKLAPTVFQWQGTLSCPDFPLWL